MWVTAAIGMACGAGLALLAIAVTAAHFVVVFVYPRLAAQLPGSRYLGFGVRVVYEDGRGILREILAQSTTLGFAIANLDTHEIEHDVLGKAAVAVTLEVQGQPTADQLAVELSELEGVLEVTTTDLGASSD